MLCAFPIQLAFGNTVPCGQCMPCRINKQRGWVVRLLLEAADHEHSWFVTLTYSPEHLPVLPDGKGTLFPDHLSGFMKRLRKDAGEGIRFFGVGEYGTRTWRPHYHLILFGLPEKWVQVDPRNGRLQFVRSGWWPFGFHSIAEFDRARAQYVSHYTTKKLTNVKGSNLELLAGRVPEFMRCSRRPGIGSVAVERLARMYQSERGSIVVAELGDIIQQVRVEGRVWPLTRFLSEKVRGALGVPLLASERPENPFRRVEPTDGEKAEAVERHDKLVRRAKSHGVL